MSVQRNGPDVPQRASEAPESPLGCQPTGSKGRCQRRPAGVRVTRLDVARDERREGPGEMPTRRRDVRVNRQPPGPRLGKALAESHLPELGDPPA